MASFRLSFALWYHSSTFPYPTAQGDGQWAAVIPWYLLFAFSSLSHCSSALVWVLQERPVPPWAFSSKEIFPCPAWVRSVDILSSVLSKGISGSLCFRDVCCQEPHLQTEFYTSHTEGILVPEQDLAWQSCGSSHVEGTALFQGHSEPGCIINAMAHFRQE